MYENRIEGHVLSSVRNIIKTNHAKMDASGHKWQRPPAKRSKFITETPQVYSM